MYKIQIYVIKLLIAFFAIVSVYFSANILLTFLYLPKETSIALLKHWTFVGFEVLCLTEIAIYQYAKNKKKREKKIWTTIIWIITIPLLICLLGLVEQFL